tara:strand:+ start:554 stop:1447 length:894 start_codon:yes stop_codon:yes gene_type:complete
MITNPKTFIIVGCEGFIGSSSALNLANKGHNIIAMDVPNAKGRSIYSIQINSHPRIRTIYNSSLKSIPWDQIDDEPTIIYTALKSSHLNDKKKLAVNCLPDLETLSELIESIPTNKKPNISYLSSCAVYGNARGQINESIKLESLNPYAFMKRTSESMLKYYSSQLNLNIRVFRLFTCYGPTQNNVNIIGKLLNSISDGKVVKLFQKGSQVRDFLYIDDLIAAISMTNFSDGYSIYNLGGDESLSLRNFADLISANYLVEGEENDDDVILCDNSLIKHETGWTPIIKINDGINKIVS